MRWWRGLVVGLALAVLLAGAAATMAQDAPEKAPKPKKAPAEKVEKPPSALKGEYAIMASELKMNDDQKAQLEAAVKAKGEAIGAWEKANADKLESLKKDTAAAKEKDDKDALKKLGDEMKALTGEKNKIAEEHDAKIMGILTPAQKADWEGFALYRSVMGKYKKCELADDQVARVRSMCGAAAKQIAAVSGEPKEADKAKGEIRKKLATDIEEQVLTAEQKAKLAAPPAEKEAKPEKAPKAEKAEKAPKEAKKPAPPVEEPGEE